MRVKYALLVSFYFLLWSQESYGQNLVPNPSFEDYSICPQYVGQLENSLNWLNFGNSPDYWNECGPPLAGIPNLDFGYQYAHSGAGMAGLVYYRQPLSPSGPNHREFIGVQLSQPLIIGTKYFLSFYINYTYNFNVALACNNQGLKFSTTPFDSCCPPPLTNWTHLNNDSIFQDSVNWKKINGSFVADSIYQYLILGNFYDDAHTDTLNLCPTPDYSYYYVDDICVSTDSVYNQTWTSIPEHTSSNYNIYPNPVQNTLTINSKKSEFHYTLYNSTGKELTTGVVLTQVCNLDFSSFDSGMYVLKLSNNEGCLQYKILHQSN